MAKKGAFLTLCFTLDKKEISMTKTGVSSLLVAFCIVAVSSSYPHRQVKAAEEQDLRKQLLGAWGLVGSPAAEGEPEKGRFKFLGLHHWSTTQTNPETGEIVYHHGGIYTLEGDEYTETVLFATGTSAGQLGRSYKFKIKVEGDTFIQTGVDNPYSEKWVRLKKVTK